MKPSFKPRPSSNIHLGFQIAPMIDVVFVIMLYFMVMSGAVEVENAHNTKLPTPVEPLNECFLIGFGKSFHKWFNFFN